MQLPPSAAQRRPVGFGRGLKFVGALVAVAMALPAPVVHARSPPPPPAASTQERAKQLNLAGQRHFDAQNYEAAAEAWSQILAILPENEVNRAERDNTLLIALEACKEGYRTRRSRGDEGLAEAVAILRKCVAAYDQYTDQFRQAYGGMAISPAATVSGVEVRRMLEMAERELGGSSTSPPPIIPEPEGHRIDLPRGPSGNGLIAGGAVLLGLGLGATSMIIVGAKRAGDARVERDEAQSAMDEAARSAADRKGKRANGLIAGGAVLTGLLLAGGATMLAFGIRRRIRYQAFHPIVGPQFVGLGLRGQF